MKSKSLARVHHEGKAARRRRRHSKLSRKAHHNPKIHTAVWVVGAVVLLGGGYLGWRYMKMHPTLTAGGTYSIPAGTAVLTLPAGATWVGLVQTAPVALNSSLTLATPGSSAPLTIPGVAYVTYIATWTDSSGATQTATVSFA
jgi:heme/copper-type cytochrome/quinol oxidase subunit 2